jgi:hypothetical protein
LTVRRVENELEPEVTSKDRWMKGPDQKIVERRASGGRLSLRVRGGESSVSLRMLRWCAANHAAWGGDERMTGLEVSEEP